MTTPLPEVRVLWRPEQFNRVSNPGFETNTTGWSVSSGINAAATSITRITTDSRSGSACGRLICTDTDGSGVNFDLGSDRYFAEATYGSIYVAVVWLKLASGSGRAKVILGSEGTSSDRASVTVDIVEGWRPVVVRWLPTANRTDAQLAITNGSAEAVTMRIDDVAVYQMDAFSQVENGTFETDTTGWSVSAGNFAAAATSITRTAGGYGGSWCGRLTTTASASSGVTYDLGDRRFVSGRTYRARVAVRTVSGFLGYVLHLGSPTSSDSATTSITSSAAWTVHTVDWTPSADRANVEVAVYSAGSSVRSVDIDELEVYEAVDDLGTDAGATMSWERSLEQPGAIVVPVLDADGTYDPRNASGPLYGSLMPGKRILGRASYEEALYPLFYGTLRSIEAPPLGGIHTTLLANDVLADLSRAVVSHDFDETDTYAYARQATHFMVVAGLSDAVGVSSIQGSSRRDVSTYSTEGNTFYNATDGTTNALDYLRALNEATGSAHYCEPKIVPNVGWQYVTASRAQLTSNTSTWTIDEDFEDLTGVRATDDTLENRQEVPWQAYVQLPPPDHSNGFGVVAEAFDPTVYGGDGSGDEPYFTYTREEYGTDADSAEPRFLYFINGAWRWRRRIDRKERKKKGIKIKRGTRLYPDALVPFSTVAGDSLELVIDFAVPVSGPVVYTGGSATTEVRYREQRPNRVVVDIVTTGAGTVDYLAVAGTPWRALDELVEVRYGSSWDPVTVPYEGPGFATPYIPSKGDAEGLGDHRNWRWGEARLTPTLVSHNTFPRDLTIELMDRVTLSADRWRIDGLLFLVTGIRWEVSQGGLDWRVRVDLEELPTHTDWLELDHATLGLDEDVVLAY